MTTASQMAEALEQMIACHGEESCPAIDVAEAALAQYRADAGKEAEGWTVIGPDGSRFTDETPLRAAIQANRHRVRVDPAAAKQFHEAIEQFRREGQEEREQCEAKFGTLDCPACGGSGHVGDCTGATGAPLTREEFDRALKPMEPRGFLLHWPSMGGGRRPVWSEASTAAEAIGCPYEALFSAGITSSRKD